MKDLSTDDIFSILNDARLFNISYRDWQLPLHKALVANLFLSQVQEHIFRSLVLNISWDAK